MLGAVIALLAMPSAADAIAVDTILEDLPVSKHGINLFSTPVALCRGAVVVVSVEEGTNGSNRLRTVARIGTQSSPGGWQWQQTTVEPRTLPDDYHTQPSVGVDPLGHVHIAYNMHNMPWQYVVSRTPCSVDSFEFRGEAVSDEQLAEVFEHNRTPFPGAGSAAIPGNQVTYPAFFNDRDGELYITYRYAVRPARAWLEREFSAGIAHFDAPLNQWQALGTLPFSWEPGWTVYPPRLWFDARNAMHAVWTWREREAGQDTVHPSYALLVAGSESFVRADGTAYRLPIRIAEVAESEIVHERVNATASVTTDGLAPLVVLQPAGGQRVLAAFDASTHRWHSQGASPYGASSVLCDDDGTCWAYASGPRVLIRKRGSQTWRLVFERSGYCDPKPLHDARTGRHLLHLTRCDQHAVSVLELHRRT